MGFVEAIADSKKITQARYLVHGTKKKKEKNRTIILPFTLINFVISNLVIIRCNYKVPFPRGPLCASPAGLTTPSCALYAPAEHTGGRGRTRSGITPWGRPTPVPLGARKKRSTATTASWLGTRGGCRERPTPRPIVARRRRRSHHHRSKYCSTCAKFTRELLLVSSRSSSVCRHRSGMALLATSL